LVLACRSPVYDQCINTIRRTWGGRSHNDVDIYYVYGGQGGTNISDLVSIESLIGHAKPELNDNEVWVGNDIILCGAADIIQEQQDCLLRKRLIAFNYLANEKKYDFIYTICASSYVDIDELKDYINNLSPSGVYHGPIGVCQSTGYPFISGSSILLSQDMAARLADNADAIIAFNNGNYADDVTFGYWIAEMICNESVADICTSIKESKKVSKLDAFVLPYNRGMTNFVHVPEEKHLPSEQMYHYHFNAQRIWEMEAFHLRFFAHSQ